MKRRTFLLASGAGLSGLAGLYSYQGWQEITPVVHYPGRDLGHAIRDATLHAAYPVESSAQPVLRPKVVIVGSGIAGLTAAWKLHQQGLHDYLLLQGPELFGNAAGGEQAGCAYPTGAHYLPLPSMASTHVRELLSDLGILLRNPYADRPYYDESALVHAPEERVLFQGQWQEGLLPMQNIGTAEFAEHTRFLQQMAQWRYAQGSDGRKVFAIPLVQSSQDPAWRALDQLSFKQWLWQQGYQSPYLHWYANYCCRDDYGQSYDQVSAWAGLHYFCSRAGEAENAEPGAVLTWPNGLHYLAERLFERAELTTRSKAWTAVHIAEQVDSVRLRCIDNQTHVQYEIEAEQVICAMPLAVAARVVNHIEQYGFDVTQHLPPSAPWLVANFLLSRFPAELSSPARTDGIEPRWPDREEQSNPQQSLKDLAADAVPLSWDNVVYEGKGLGYVVSTHQDLRVAPPPKTVFTAYHALSDMKPQQARAWLNQASPEALLTLAMSDLQAAYGWRFKPNVDSVAITVRAHAMASPHVGFLANPGLVALRECRGRLQFAHADLSGMSLFEEASWWGYQAANNVLANS